MIINKIEVVFRSDDYSFDATVSLQAINPGLPNFLAFQIQEAGDKEFPLHFSQNCNIIWILLLTSLVHSNACKFFGLVFLPNQEYSIPFIVFFNEPNDLNFLKQVNIIDLEVINYKSILFITSCLSFFDCRRQFRFENILFVALRDYWVYYLVSTELHLFL